MGVSLSFFEHSLPFCFFFIKLFFVFIKKYIYYNKKFIEQIKNQENMHISTQQIMKFKEVM